MIQRIQTVYLLISEILTAILFLVPFAGISGQNGLLYRADIQGLYLERTPNQELLQRHWPIFIFVVAILILVFATIFLYKDRKLQIRLSAISLLAQLCLCAMIFFEVWSGAQRLSGHISFTIFMVFPFISAILILLAFRAIKHDELLVKSIDRIR